MCYSSQFGRTTSWIGYVDFRTLKVFSDGRSRGSMALPRKSTSKFEKVLSNLGKVRGNFMIQSEGSQSSVEKK